jgi:hypothetical protein
VRCHLNIGDLFLDREAIDHLLCCERGWSRKSLFHDTGDPRAQVTLQLPKRNRKAIGRIGEGGEHAFELPSTTLIEDIAITLVPMGGGLAACLTWNFEGGELEDLAPLLGKATAIEIQIEDPWQNDLLETKASDTDEGSTDE